MHYSSPQLSSPVSLFLATLSLILLALVSGSFAQTQEPANASVEDALRVTITSAQGRERHLLSHNRVADRVGLRPGQRVAITLQLPASYAGEAVDIGSVDGGQVVAREGLSVPVNGKFHCGFQASNLPGLYRISVQIGIEQYLLQFYVLDLEHAEKNPPRVRIVD